jgi:hypothetical protein
MGIARPHEVGVFRTLTKSLPCENAVFSSSKGSQPSPNVGSVPLSPPPKNAQVPGDGVCVVRNQKPFSL